MFLDFTLPQHCTISLPKLQFLHVILSLQRDIDFVLFSGWSMANLTHLSVSGFYSDSNGIIPFLQQHGPQLLTIKFDDAGDNVDHLLLMCTSLTHLKYNISYPPSEPIRHPTLTSISITGIDLDKDNIEWLTNALHEHFQIIAENDTPHLHTVQLLDFNLNDFTYSSYSVCVRAYWFLWYAQLFRKSITIFDKCHRPLLFSLPIVPSSTEIMEVLAQN